MVYRLALHRFALTIAFRGPSRDLELLTVPSQPICLRWTKTRVSKSWHTSRGSTCLRYGPRLVREREVAEHHVTSPVCSTTGRVPYGTVSGGAPRRPLTSVCESLETPESLEGNPHLRSDPPYPFLSVGPSPLVPTSVPPVTRSLGVLDYHGNDPGYNRLDLRSPVWIHKLCKFEKSMNFNIF